MKTHSFTLILAGVANITPKLADALYEATHGDIELNMLDGVAFLEFERKAPTLREAITTAVRDVESTDIWRCVLCARGIRIEAANVIAKINADLLGVALKRSINGLEAVSKRHTRIGAVYA